MNIFNYYNKIFLLFFSLITFSYAGNENALRQSLFVNYNNKIIPSNDSLNLKIGIEIKNLEYFDQKAEKIKLNLILTEEWIDDNINWNNTINYILVDKDMLWKPDLELYNAASKPEEFEDIRQIQIYRNGKINWNKPILYSFSCPLQLQDFPFDTQKCKMTFGSWKFSADYLNITLLDDPIKIAPDFSHNEWVITNVYYQHLDLEYLCCPDVLWSVNEFEIELKRNSNKFIITIMMTCLLTLSSLSVTTLSVKNYKRPYILIFIPLSIIWIQIDISSKIPVIEYKTKIEQILLCSFLTCMLCALESIILYWILTNKYFLDKNNNIESKHKIKEFDIIVKDSDSKNKKLQKYLKCFDKIFRRTIIIVYFTSIIILIN